MTRKNKLNVAQLLMILGIIPLLLIAAFITSCQSAVPESPQMTWKFDKSLYYLGDTGSVTVNITNNVGQPIRIDRIELHLEWLVNGSYRKDFSDSPIYVEIGDTKTFTFNIEVYADGVSVGYNGYYFRLEYAVYNPVTGRYISHRENTDKYALWIETPLQITADIMLNKANGAITEAINANFTSPDAKALLQQAISERDLAVQLFSIRDFSGSITHSQNAINLIAQAHSAEAAYKASQEQAAARERTMVNTILASAGMISASIIIVAILSVYFIRKPKAP